MRFSFAKLVCAFLICFFTSVNATDKFISDELDTPLYNLTVSATYTGVSDKSPLQFALESGVGKSEIIVTLQKKYLNITTIINGRENEVGKVKIDYIHGKPVEFTVLRRDDWLSVLHNDTIIWHGSVPHLQGGNAEWRKQAGWIINSAKVQRLEPVIFSDDFMRTADESGQWLIKSGNWKLQSAWDKDPKGGSKKFINQIYAQNPFAWVGSSKNGLSALCAVGEPNWEDYTASAAIQAPRDGAVGVVVNMTGADTGILARWTPVTDKSERGNRICLIAINHGKETTLAESKGGYLPGQWYKLSVVSTMTGIQVLVDGKERLSKDGVTPWRGGVGLYAEGDAGTIFDDVTVYGHSVKTDLMNEHIVAKIAQRFIDDHKGMATWAAASKDWQPIPNIPGFFVHRFNYYGDHWLSLETKLTNAPDGQLVLILNSDGVHTDTGYRAVLKRDGKFISASLYRDAQLLKNKTINMDNDESYAIRLWHTGNLLKLEIDDETILEVNDPKPLTGFRPAYSATGCFTLADDVMAIGHNLLDYSFADAPTDWLTEGTWMPTTRWSCSNQWSFLSGWSRGDVAIWHKKSFTGDQFIDAYLGIKMEYPRERETYWTRFRDMAVTICGDGKNPRSGYSGIVGATGTDERPTQRTILLRNGVEVASANIVIPGSINGGHTHWFQLELHKTGSSIEFWVDGIKRITYNDPIPINSGVPAVWTSDNGISLARVRIGSSSTPVTRNDQQITIDEPWYPEWGNVGKQMVIDVNGVASTGDAPVKLQVKKRITPDKTTDPTVNGMQVTMTPTNAGDYWYQVNATDGKVNSPDFNINLPVYTPSMGRNDTDAMVLYRYNEGSGSVIHDYAAIGTPANLTINNKDATQWIPGQGLSIHGASRIMSAAVPKLMELAKKKTCTIEVWISTDTVYAPTYWLGGILAWELPNEQRNFAIGHIFRDFVFSPCGTKFNPLERKSPHFNYIRTGLQHIVITWDGVTTRAYINGTLVGQSNVNWQSDKWSPDAPLIVGSLNSGQPDNGDNIARSIGVGLYIMPRQVEMQHTYLGTLYLTAIHKKCMTPEEVKNNYQAGPSAK